MKRPYALVLSALAFSMGTLSLLAENVVVTSSTGLVTSQAPGEASARPVVKGDILNLGTRIATGDDGRVSFTPSPGVNSFAASNSDFVLESSSEAPASDGTVKHKTTLSLTKGTIISDLKKPAGVSYDYSIRTPKSIAAARGTTFTVSINELGVENVIVANGTVSTTFANGTVISLTAGQLSITKADGSGGQVNAFTDLSAEDQATVKALAELTVQTLLDAASAGIPVDAGALADVLAAVKALGIEISPELLSTAEAQVEAEQNVEPVPVTPSIVTPTKPIAR
jgi:hypothetical protein